MAKNFQNEEMRNEEFTVEDDSPSEDRDDMVTYFMKLYREYESSEYRRQKIEDAAENRKRYDGDRDSKNFPWENCSNYSLMTEAIVVDNLEPRLVAAVAGKDRDIVEALPNSSKGVEFAKEVEKFAEWALAHNIKWQDNVPAWIHNVLLDGTLYIFPYYKEQKLIRGERFVGKVAVNPFTMERITDEESLRALIMQGIRPEEMPVDEIQKKDVRIFKVVNDYALMNEVYGPDICPDWDETPTIRKQFFKYADLEENSKENGGVYINITKKLLDSATTTRDDEDLPPGSDRDGAAPEVEREDIEVLTFYDRYDIGEGRDWVIVSIAKNTETVIRKQYVRDVYYGLIGKPCKRLVIFPDFGKQFGTGVPHKIRHHALSINDCLNQMLDSGAAQINPWFFYGSDVGLQDELDISPGGANPVVGNANSIVFPNVGVKAQVYIEFINLITSFLERLIAMSSYQSGVEDQAMGQGAGTAAGMRMILQEAQVKHTYQAKPIKEQLEDVIKLDMMLYSWYMPTDAEIVLPGGQVLRGINVDALQQDYDFSLRISDSAYNKMMARYEAQELLGLAASFPFANQMQLFMDALQAYDKKNPEIYIEPAFLMLIQAVAQNPEIPQVVQQYIQDKMQKMHQQELGQAAQDGETVSRMREALKDQQAIPDMQKAVEKNLMKRKIQDSMEMAAALEHKNMIGPKDIQDAMASQKRKLAKDVVEGSMA